MLFWNYVFRTFQKILSWLSYIFFYKFLTNFLSPGLRYSKQKFNKKNFLMFFVVFFMLFGCFKIFWVDWAILFFTNSELRYSRLRFFFLQKIDFLKLCYSGIFHSVENHFLGSGPKAAMFCRMQGIFCSSIRPALTRLGPVGPRPGGLGQGPGLGGLGQGPGGLGRGAWAGRPGPGGLGWETWAGGPWPGGLGQGA